MPVTTTSDAECLAEQLDPAALAAAASEATNTEAEALETLSPRKSRKSVLALAVCALAINGTAAIVTLPGDIHLPDVATALAELLPRQKPAAPKPDPVVAALKDIKAAQEEHTASLQASNYSLQQHTALLQQDSMVILSLRQSITDERVDVKKISSQLSTLIAKIDSLQNTMTSDVTSAIPRGHARSRLFVGKRMARQPKPVGPVGPIGPVGTVGPVGPVSVGGAPLSVPATIPAAPES
ncbi:hypothetical protein C2U70_08255 [Bradyrhizobium guangdongense]|uniref:hypothetical protein n=1 Tax=Bradyrhizobium guangdongense TaxID=1325090 RepID=UPI00112C0F50|nr:hypothetical protein [Bradyrhizobium guangdongense]TPQ38874.1 hypothetical protein C2U70_08255 [Bradyrhizobium guangdongense]